MSKKNLKVYSLLVWLIICLISLCFSGVSVNADSSYYDINIISSSSFDDLPDTENTNNPWLLNRVTFGSILYNGRPVFYNVLTGSLRYSVFFVSNCYLDTSQDYTIDDDQFFVILSDLDILQRAVLSQLKSLGYIDYDMTVSNYHVYTNLNYQDCIICRESNMTNRVITDGYDTYVYEYYDALGPINTAFYQSDLMNNIINFYDPDNLGLSSYQSAYKQGYDTGVAMGSQDSKYYQSLYESAQLTIDELHEQLNDPTNFDNLTFYNLLSNISMYPVNFFKEGLDVEIFGVNVGNVMLGVFMITLTISLAGIIRKFLGK